jgi:hypothetical protein
MFANNLSERTFPCKYESRRIKVRLDSRKIALPYSIKTHKRVMTNDTHISAANILVKLNVLISADEVHFAL